MTWQRAVIVDGLLLAHGLEWTLTNEDTDEPAPTFTYHGQAWVESNRIAIERGPHVYAFKIGPQPRPASTIKPGENTPPSKSGAAGQATTRATPTSQVGPRSGRSATPIGCAAGPVT